MNVLILGFGKSGFGAAKLALDSKWRVTISDTKERGSFPKEYLALEKKGAKLIFGFQTKNLLKKFDQIIISPGIPRTIEVVREAEAIGIPIISELELAYSFLKGRVIGITGSNGKSTTTMMIAHLISGIFSDVRLGGNLGTPLSEIVHGSTDDTIFVVEVSSFQLEAIKSFRAHVAVLLNVTPDHLDRYPGFEDYQIVKGKIFQNQQKEDFAIFNWDDPFSRKEGLHSSGNIMPFSHHETIEQGFFLVKNTVYSKEKETKPFFLIDDIPLKGIHNLENAMAAAGAALCMGVPPEHIRTKLPRFKGLPHRMEPAGSFNGIDAYNDSKATNMDAVFKALSAFQKNVILILGGRDKDGHFEILAPEVNRRCKAVIAMGEARYKVERALIKATGISMVDTLHDAVEKAVSMAVKGDVILLSPGCASYDQFKNFEERGEVFKKLIKKYFTQPPLEKTDVKKVMATLKKQKKLKYTIKKVAKKTIKKKNATMLKKGKKG